MAKHPVIVELEGIKYHFYVGEYPLHDDQRCKFKVYYQGALVATFAPDRHHILHLCKNYGHLKEQLLDLIADQIEPLHVYGFFEQRS
ncbi:MAG: hypothetical protein EOO88_30275 [Pedobacter sp.]|nr:MAG: hypothetical protein EOO88_30275 [Pedobacter sp.]